MFRLLAFVFCCLVFQVNCLDLLGIQLSVPALEKDGAVPLLGEGNTNKKPTPVTTESVVPQSKPTPDLLGLQLSVPPLEKEGAVTNLLGGGGSKPKQPQTTQKPVVPLSDPIPTPEKTCSESRTRINGGHVACSGALLFEDHFNVGLLNSTKWEKQQFVADAPDYEFVTYEKRAQNCYISDGVLHLKATLRDDPTVAKIDLTQGCTGRNCTLSVGRNVYILPPIVAGKIKSKFSFLYGKIEIRAQLPKGDWLYPLVNLDPKGYFTYARGRLWMAYARGNLDLIRAETQEQIGNNILYAGGVLAEEEPGRTYAALKITGEEPWGNDFHVYTMIWTPDGITISVDGKEKGHINPPFTNSGSSYGVLWEGMEPFTEEFILSLGISAGGFSDFPEGTTSNGSKKPWRRLSARPIVNFYEARDKWMPSWRGDNSALKVDYVKVWAL